jgi:hypothetical protein
VRSVFLFSLIRNENVIEFEVLLVLIVFWIVMPYISERA